MNQFDPKTINMTLEMAAIKEKQQYVTKRRTERAFAQEEFLERELGAVADVTIEDHDDVFASFQGSILESYKRVFKQESASLDDAVPFICSEFDQKFRLVPGQLMTVAAYTGSGKSTTTVNVAARYIMEGKRAFIISNEEAGKDLYDMVACILEGIDHRDVVQRAIPAATQKRLIERVTRLVTDKELFVIDGELSNNGTTKAEYILNMIKCWNEASVKPDVVLIDYLTNIYSAGSSSADNHYFQLEKFLTDLKNLINTLSFPVIMAAQMHSDDKKKGTALDQKLIMGGAIQRYSTIVVEVKTDHDVGASEYIIHKNRRFKQKGKITLKYDRGMMRPLENGEKLFPQSVMEAAEDPED